jgi:hypothetical protein
MISIQTQKIYNFGFKQFLNTVRVFRDDRTCSFVGTNIWEEATAFMKSIIFWDTRRHIPEDDTLQNHLCENLKSYILPSSSRVTLLL